MPVHMLASTITTLLPTEYYATAAAALVALSFLKTWSRGATLLDLPPTHYTPLHGRIVLVASGAFTPLGVVTLSALAHRGAQIIALTPDPSSAQVVQLVHLIRDSTRSELVYAEQCDLGDLQSVSQFAALWNAGGGEKQGAGVRRLDALLFLPPSRDELRSVRSVQRRREAIYQLHVLAQFHLVNSLLSSLLLQPPERELRVVSVVSPFYAAGVSHFDVLANSTRSATSKGGSSKKSTTPKAQLQALSESSYTALIGAASLRWHALTVELQRRVDLLAEADPRPKTKLPGIDIPTPTPTSTSRPDSIQAQAATRMRRHSNISTLSVCTGFERSHDIIETFLPPVADDGILSTLRAVVRFVALLVLWPVVWLLAKSPATAADSIVWATTRHLEPLSARLERVLASLSSGDAQQVRKWQDHLVPAEMYREGRIVRPQLPSRFADDDRAWSELWTQTEGEVEARVKQLGGQIKRPSGL
ncbi:conserved hypothetical protein [Sporisorium reilianum SRZ2]|uniref:Ketoreductase (KR) domain-containing protein n=1 Tax=Sporisorium reilianum (strain SRZ2) TaxID=999809 RepID=E7A224_SPORE|nr:conserved hypothetical protein [Sporisorium reilianum SRZ2]